MKTKSQKTEELNKGKKLLETSEAVLFIDFSKVKTADMRNLRKELKANGNPMLVIKKSLLGLMFGDGVDMDQPDFKTSVAVVFASNIESASSSIYKFFQALEKEKKVDSIKMLGAYDVKNAIFMPKTQIIAIGKLLPREVILAQLLGMLAAPIRSFLYVLDQKSKQGVASGV